MNYLEGGHTNHEHLLYMYATFGLGPVSILTCSKQQWWIITRNIFSSIVLKYKCKVLDLSTYLDFCSTIFQILHYIYHDSYIYFSYVKWISLVNMHCYRLNHHYYYKISSNLTIFRCCLHGNEFKLSGTFFVVIFITQVYYLFLLT